MTEPLAPVLDELVVFFDDDNEDVTRPYRVIPVELAQTAEMPAVDLAILRFDCRVTL